MTGLPILRQPDRLYHTLSVRQLVEVTLPPTLHSTEKAQPAAAAVTARSNKKFNRKRSQLRSVRIDTDAECNDRTLSNASDQDDECDDLLAPRSRRQTQLKGIYSLLTSYLVCSTFVSSSYAELTC
jgi:hypothetical protein